MDKMTKKTRQSRIAKAIKNPQILDIIDVPKQSCGFLEAIIAYKNLNKLRINRHDVVLKVIMACL